MPNLAPSQRQEWVGTKIMYRHKTKRPIFFGLFSRTEFSAPHTAEVVNATASSVAFRSGLILDFFTGQPLQGPDIWVHLDEIQIVDVLPHT